MGEFEEKKMMDKMNGKKRMILPLLVVMILFLAGCTQNQDSDSETTGEESMARTAIHITDAPIDDFTHLNITFSMVKLHSNESGWENITVDEENQTVDLLNLHLNDLVDSLISTNLPIGNYTKLWLVIENATGVLNDTSEEITLTVPSNILKIQQLFKLVEGDHDITLEIDLNASIHSYKGGTEYKILPVLGGIMHKHNNQLQFQEKDKNKLKNNVENRKPVITILINDGIQKHINVNINETITFDASETFDIDEDQLLYLWDFGDGNTSDDLVVDYNYSKSGSYTVTLTVTDEDGLEETEKITVTVQKNKGNGNGN